MYDREQLLKRREELEKERLKFEYGIHQCVGAIALIDELLNSEKKENPNGESNVS